jgi:hypothetical protein
MSTVTDEIDRAAEYVETKIDKLTEVIKATLAEGMSYDLEVRKGGKKVHQVPVAIAGILAGLSVLPPARLASLVGLAGAGALGYTFHLRKIPAVTPTK